MLQNVMAALVIAALFVTFILLPVLMVRGIVQVRRERRSGSVISSGIAGMMTEIDRAVRPSVEHVIDAEELADAQDDDIGGE